MKPFICTLLFALTLSSNVAVAQSTPSVPEFTGIKQWVNSEPLTMSGLRGKVVLIDFWAYSCINCLRAIPHAEHLYETYKDKGLVVIGVHSPEFDFEKDSGNVREAVKRLDITYPVAIDSDLGTWNAWHNQYWPAEYLIDQNGHLIGHHYGEGNYLEMENAIRVLLGLAVLPQGSQASGAGQSTNDSPEMFIGSLHQANLASPEGGDNGIRHFSAPPQLALNQFALTGLWEITDQYARLAGKSGEIRLHFRAGKLNMVASADQPISIEISIDGKPQPAVTVQASRLYTLFDNGDDRDHVLTLHIPQSELRVYTFTTG